MTSNITTSLDISRVKLRPTTTQDRSAPIIKGEIDQINIDQYQNCVLDINLESWINIIKEETFSTQLLPLTPDNGRTFLKAYEELQVKRSHLSNEVSEELEKIAEELQRVIDKVRSNGPGVSEDDCVFVKTSCRSAKDAAVFDSNFRSLYRERLSTPGRNPFHENDQLRSLLEAGRFSSLLTLDSSFFTLHSPSSISTSNSPSFLLQGLEALKTRSASKLLVDVFCTSERVYQDLTLALEHLDRFEQHFIVRKWKTIDPGMEFRGFFNKGRLNALSQYNHLVLYPEVVQKEKEILSKILRFFETNVQPKLDQSRLFQNGYVIDFAITTGEDGSLGDVWVIELNPFLYSTDACLFSWKDERELLENGPFEFRIRTKELIGSKALLGINWRDVVEMEAKEMKKK
jgi:gamma-glutamylcyclotransferase (GGCT)/AIG2-like uncharacterized protein YtfP